MCVFCKHFLDKVAKHFWTLLQYEINTLWRIHVVNGGMTADLYRGIGTNFKHNNLISGKKSK